MNELLNEKPKKKKKNYKRFIKSRTFQQINHLWQVSFLRVDSSSHLVSFSFCQKTLNISCSSYLLMMNAFSFCMPENVFMYLYFEGKSFCIKNLRLRVFFQNFKDDILLPFDLTTVCQEVCNHFVPLDVVCLFTCCF